MVSSYKALGFSGHGFRKLIIHLKACRLLDVEVRQLGRWKPRESKHVVPSPGFSGGPGSMPRAFDSQTSAPSPMTLPRAALWPWRAWGGAEEPVSQGAPQPRPPVRAPGGTRRVGFHGGRHRPGWREGSSGSCIPASAPFCELGELHIPQQRSNSARAGTWEQYSGCLSVPLCLCRGALAQGPTRATLQGSLICPQRLTVLICEMGTLVIRILHWGSLMSRWDPVDECAS